MRNTVVLVALALSACASSSDVCLKECAGCCDTMGNCHRGDEPTACGPTGKLCVICAAGEQCGFFSTCYRGCSLLNCAGCCAADDTCHAGTQATQCGGDGSQCVDCTATGKSCSAGSCR